MASLDSYLDDLLARGRAYFSRDEVAAAPSALAAVMTRAINKRRLANPRYGFYLILRPEDQIAGAPDPVKWIDPLMKQSSLVDQMKSDAGFATVAGIELTLLDCVHYFHKAAGINSVAQIAKDIGAKAGRQ